MEILSSLSAFPEVKFPVIIAQQASTMYLKDMGRLSCLSSLFGAILVSKILHGSWILERTGLRARATADCCALCLLCLSRQCSKQFASLLVRKGMVKTTLFSQTSVFMPNFASVELFTPLATSVLLDPFCGLLATFLIEIKPSAFRVTTSKRELVGWLRNSSPLFPASSFEVMLDILGQKVAILRK